MTIMKFGGSSVGTGKRILHVADVINSYQEDDEIIVVVSAMKSVTDRLVSVLDKHKNGEIAAAHEDLRDLYKIHNVALDELELTPDHYFEVSKSLLNVIGRLNSYLNDQKEVLPLDQDYVLSFGERFSSYLIAAALNKKGRAAKTICASKVIVATEEFTNARPIIKETIKLAKENLSPMLNKKIIPIVPGFYAATKDGKVVTLGRGGSDYSATIIAHAMDADQVILWKEVDGVFTSDPKTNPDAQFYPELTYKEALKLAKDGAKILHPEAMIPVESKDITVWVKNTFNPQFIGTKICAEI